MNGGMKTRNFAPPERMAQLCNKALDIISKLLTGGEEKDYVTTLYSWLSEEVGMTDEEIISAGFDCVPSNVDELSCCRYSTPRTLDWCEKNCVRYYSCDTAAIELDKSNEDGQKYEN